MIRYSKLITLTLALLLALPTLPVRAACASPYVVQRGDSLDRIARNCDTTVEELMSVNELTSSVIREGQSLVIPGVAAAPASTPPPARTDAATTYFVQPGDSWARIAQLHGVSVDDLQTANPELTSNVLQLGQEIAIPSASLRTGPSGAQRPEVAVTTPAATAAPTQAAAVSAPPAAPTSAFGGERLALANYFTWYGGDIWSQGVTWDTPLIPYLSMESSAIERHINWAQQANLDGFVVYWWHAGDQTSANFNTLLNISRGRNFRSAVNFQGHLIPGVTYENLVGNLSFILKIYRDDPNYLHIDGKPVIFFSDMPRVPLPQNPVVVWGKVRDEVDPERQSIWIAEGLDPSYLTVFDGLFIFKIDHACCPELHKNAPAWAYWVRQYARQTGQPKLWIATIQPGWDDTNWNRPDLREPSPAFAIDREDGDYYRRTFEAVINTDPDILLVNSFNEWIEGSQIEPGSTYGDLYLNLTAQFVAQYKGQ